MPPKDVRKLFKQQRTERQKEKRVDHPFAKYDAQDRLVCVICTSPIKDASAWPSHLTSSSHKENIARLKAAKEQKIAAAKKRRPDPTATPPSELEAHPAKRSRRDDQQGIQDEPSDDEMEDSSQLPSDFFDTPTLSSTKGAKADMLAEGDNDGKNDDDDAKEEEEEEQEEEEEEEEEAQEGLPTGFFDNPEEEAKVRKKQSVNPNMEAKLKADMAAFQELMAEAPIPDQADQGGGDQEKEQDEEEVDEHEGWMERNEEQFRQQADFDSRVEHLKLMRQHGIAHTQPQADVRMQDTVPNDPESEIRAGLKSTVRSFLKKAGPVSTKSVFDDMDEDTSEDSDEDDWRAQQLV